MKILVVCGAGASSTFVALRLRRSATLRGLTVSVTAITESDLLGRLSAATAHSPVDVVLVGPHLAPAFPAIAQQCAEYGAKGRLLPISIFTDRDGEAALDLALTATGERPLHNPAQHTTTKQERS
ncbi:hypothetical protein [Cryobacterium sp. PH31-L1]|uniref:PTS sugar transporter subunit IIB n=1 Tax=Cryobacterium sp. PH31-L1 TaxID=3046199 RepID=UPI0024BB06A7|nr:hypothetical protein [Cryobacterium sp. PH31-L1]MDJ0376067.1 hypothetical protein [Cryobacterium sp. PH31-L1]